MSVLRLITRAEIERHREALCEWLSANGVDPDQVVDRWLSIELADDERLIRFRVYRVTAGGRRLMDPDDQSRAWAEERTVPLVIELSLPIFGDRYGS